MRHLDQHVGSSHHLDMPLWDSAEMLECLKHLVALDKHWIPHFDELGQLYARFNHISTEAVMGVKTPSATKLFAILSPKTSKHKELTVKCSNNVNKNWPLGHG